MSPGTSQPLPSFQVKALILSKLNSHEFKESEVITIYLVCSPDNYAFLSQRDLHHKELNVRIHISMVPLYFR